MKLKDLIVSIHDNAVEHGWWEGERKPGHIVALIHSELSEALEEARAGRPMVWYKCHEADGHDICDPVDAADCLNYGHEAACQHHGNKPEGIAVEIVDAAIRIMDYLGYVQFYPLCEAEDLWKDENIKVRDDLADEIAELHKEVSYSFLSMENSGPDINTALLYNVLGSALTWVSRQGLDPMALIIEKHEYNRDRPYKHGKIF